MATLDLAKRKLLLIEQFMKIAVEEKIGQLELFFEKETQTKSDDYWDDLPESIQNLIDNSLKESQNNKVVSFDPLVAETKLYYQID